MSEDANARVVDGLLRLHAWLTVDFVHLLNHASQITEAECKPLYDAYRIVMEEQFRLDAAVFTMAKRTVDERLFPKISAFVDAMNAQLEARDAGNRELQQALLAQSNVLFNGLVKDFEQDLHDVRKLIERDAAAQPAIHLPSLSYVGGGRSSSSRRRGRESRTAAQVVRAVVGRHQGSGDRSWRDRSADPRDGREAAAAAGAVASQAPEGRGARREERVERL